MGDVKVADISDDDSTQYKLVYYRTTNVVEGEKEIVNVEPDHPSLGKIADVVKVGDYVNYAPTYTNVSEVKEGLGNGWRVAYVDSTSGVVTLVSEGLPLLVKNENRDDYDTEEIEFDYEEINKLLDYDVAQNIDILDLDDIQLICTQTGYTLTHTDAYNGNYQYKSENYTVENDNISIIDIQSNYLINTMGVSIYGHQNYFWTQNASFNSTGYYGDSGIRLVVDLKSDLEYYGGSGTQGDPYQIY